MTAPPMPTTRQINDSLHYTVWTTFRRAASRSEPAASASALSAWSGTLEARGVIFRGWYDISGFRGDADFMVWAHADEPEQLQSAISSLRTTLGSGAEVTWSAIGLHRPAEFNKGHVPSFMAGKPALDWVTVYPFVRSYEWYLLPEPERRAMLVEHGMLGREFPSVQSNTVSAFALGDYEWLLALECDQLHELVDMMRHLRASEARRHVREETPFFTGRRVDAGHVAAIIS